jgi:maleamate amidohydrolase
MADGATAGPGPGDATAGSGLEASYRQGGFRGRLGAGSSRALLLVDLCQAYLVPDSPLYAGDGARSAVAACARLLGTARAAGRPVLHTRIDLRSPHDAGLFVRKVPALEVFRTGSPLAEPPPEVRPAPDEEVVVKQYASAFFGTSLAATLTVLGVDTLVIGGLSTSGCVRATAVDALQHGFVPIVVAEACGDRHPAPHDASLFDLDAKYADVVGLDEATTLLEEKTT